MPCRGSNRSVPQEASSCGVYPRTDAAVRARRTSAANPASPSGTATTTSTARPARSAASPASRPYPPSTGAANTLTNGYLPPNAAIPDVVIHAAGFFGPRSHHTGGANAAFGDGSARLLAEAIDPVVLRGLHSRHGGEAGGAP